MLFSIIVRLYKTIINPLLANTWYLNINNTIIKLSRRCAEIMYVWDS